MSERTRTGLKEMPSNAAWMLSRVRDRRHRLSAAVIDAAPVGDSVEIRMKRAREAAERAQEAEERALEAEQESEECADHAHEVSERGRARLAEVREETGRQVKQRVADAKRDADEMVKREREAAEEEAREQQGQVAAEVEEEIEDAELEAEEAQGRAEALVEEASARLAEARQLAEEAAEAARAAAEEAHRQAQQLADEAEQQASTADAQVSAAEQLRERPKETAKDTARKLERLNANGGLESYHKPELVELAASIGIEGRTNRARASSSRRSLRRLAPSGERDATLPEQEPRRPNRRRDQVWRGVEEACESGPGRRREPGGPHRRKRANLGAQAPRDRSGLDGCSPREKPPGRPRTVVPAALPE